MIREDKKKLLQIKLKEIEAEMKTTGLWKKTEPAWVSTFTELDGMGKGDFMEWLQFVYIPNCMQGHTDHCRMIVTQANKYFGKDIQEGRLLQLLIELDALI